MAGKVDGFELARIVTQRWPRIKIVVTSGFPDTKIDEHSDLTADVRLLSKPYLKEELGRTLRDALDRRSRG